MTPALIQERGNVAFDYLFPDVTNFRDPNFLSRRGDGIVGERLRRGYDFMSATALDDPGKMSMFDMAAKERDELFNTRVSGYRAWAQAMQKLIPTPRGAARIDLTQMILDSGSATTGETVDYLLSRFLRVPVSSVTRDTLVAFLDEELGTSDISRAQTYMEDPLRMVTHLIMSHAGVSDQLGRPLPPLGSLESRTYERRHKTFWRALGSRPDWSRRQRGSAKVTSMLLVPLGASSSGA